MKFRNKAFALVLAAGLLATLTACGGGDAASSAPASSGPVTYFDGSQTVEITAESILTPVSAGTMNIQYFPPESESAQDDSAQAAALKLGMSSDELHALIPDGSLTRTENEDYIRQSTGTGNIYFTNDDNNNGIVALLQYGDIYGFSISTTSSDAVKSVLGTPAEEGTLSELSASRLLYGATGATYLNYEKGGNTVRFIFTADGYLQATLLYHDGFWKD